MRFLGKPYIRGLDGSRAPTEPDDWKRVGVLAYLCLNLPLRLHTDTALAALLWPTLPAAVGLRSVERATQWLNSGQEEPIVTGTRYGEYEVIQSAFSVDVWAFRGGVRLGAYRDALTLCQGGLMEGIDFPDAPEFMEWLGRQRTKYARLASLCAWRTYKSALDDGDRHLAGGLLVLAYEHSPQPLAILSRVMERLASVGAGNEALRLFHREAEPPSEAAQVARIIDPTLGPDSPKRKSGRLVGVAAFALLVLLAMSAFPDGAPEEVDAPIAPEVASQPRGEPSAPESQERLLEPAVLWDIANRHLHRGSYGQAEALFRLLLRDAEFGERSLVSAIMAHTALRDRAPSDSAQRVRDFPLPAKGSDSTTTAAASALLALWRGNVSDAAEQVQAGATPVDALSWLAATFLAIRTRNLSEAYRLIGEAPDSVFGPTEGPLPNVQLLGWVAAASGDFLRAKEHYTAAKRAAEAQIALRIDDPWGYRNLALAELGLGDVPSAAAALDRAAALASHSADPQLRFKVRETRAMVIGPDSDEGARIIQTLLEAEYPWPLQAWQLDTDPRWRSLPSPTSAPTDPGP